MSKFRVGDIVSITGEVIHEFSSSPMVEVQFVSYSNVTSNAFDDSAIFKNDDLTLVKRAERTATVELSESQIRRLLVAGNECGKLVGLQDDIDMLEQVLENLERQ